jgi:hypothetical protein
LLSGVSVTVGTWVSEAVTAGVAVGVWVGVAVSVGHWSRTKDDPLGYEGGQASGQFPAKKVRGALNISGPHQAVTGGWRS